MNSIFTLLFLRQKKLKTYYRYHVTLFYDSFILNSWFIPVHHPQTSSGTLLENQSKPQDHPVSQPSPFSQKSPNMQFHRPPVTRQTIAVPPISTLLPPKSEPLSIKPDLSLNTSPRTIKTEPTTVKSDLTLSDIIKNPSALSNSPSTIGKVEPLSSIGGESSLEQELRRNIPTIRGGLNGSIADILEASGYGTETAFTVDEDVGLV